MRTVSVFCEYKPDSFNRKGRKGLMQRSQRNNLLRINFAHFASALRTLRLRDFF